MCEQAGVTPGATVWPAQQLTAAERQQIAVEVLSGACTVSSAACENDVSRKFVYQQVSTAREALQQAFAKGECPSDDEVLFTIPVTKAWLKQLVLALVLICHSSFRGVVELLAALFDQPMSVGTVHNILADQRSSSA